MSHEPRSVAFDRELAEAPQRTAGAVDAKALRDPVMRNMTLARRATIVAGAIAIAFFSHLAGLGLGGALCVFLGLLPILYVFSLFVGMGAMVKTATKVVHDHQQQYSSPVPLGGRFQLVRRTQHVTVTLGADALEIGVRDDRGAQTDRWPWAEVRLDRTGDALIVARGTESFTVPDRAFGEPAQVQAFALEAQQRAWAARKKPAAEKT